MGLASTSFVRIFMRVGVASTMFVCICMVVGVSVGVIGQLRAGGGDAGCSKCSGTGTALRRGGTFFWGQSTC